MEQPAGFYDAANRQKVGALQAIVKRTLPAMEHTVGSVLDIACGLGQAADLTEGEYHGVDFSEFAIRYARENSGNGRATFELADFWDWDGEPRDTVLLLEVLEHVDDPAKLARLAKRLAKKRVIATVPVDMPYPSHVKAKWDFDDLAALFGNLSVKAIIGGKWLLVTHDVATVPVSVCMIVKDEEDCLQAALESTVGLADEVVVVDTGSTDATLDIAREFGCRIYTGADRMHKARSRNLAISHAIGDWVVILDADECIVDPGGLRAHIQQAQEQRRALALYVRLTYIDESGQETAALSQLRCWKRGTLHYKYRAHELPVPVNDHPKLAQVTGFMWEHRPPRKREGWKLQYTLDRLLLDVEENPDDPRPVYYLGRQYMYMKQYGEAIKWLRKHIALGGGPDIADVWYSLSRCYQRVEGYEKEQIMAMHQACAINPLRREYWGELANEYWKRGFHKLAIELMRVALSLPIMEVGVSQLAWYSDIQRKCWRSGSDVQTEYTTEQGYRLRLGRVDRRLIDRLKLGREEPRPPVRTAMAWGDVEEEIPILDDPGYQAEMMRYHLWLAKEQAEAISGAVTPLDEGRIDWTELFELENLGLEIVSAHVGLLCYLLSDRDRANVTGQVLYQSTVTARGIAEAERAYNVRWLHKPVVAWRVPSIPAELSLEFEARRVAMLYGYSWPEFCELTGPEQSAVVCHHRISNKLSWLEAEYERAKRA